MRDAGHVAAELFANTFVSPAAILVAFADDLALVILAKDVAHWETLQRVGCMADSRITPFGYDVEGVLRTKYGLKAWPYERKR